MSAGGRRKVIDSPIFRLEGSWADRLAQDRDTVSKQTMLSPSSASCETRERHRGWIADEGGNWALKRAAQPLCGGPNLEVPRMMRLRKRCKTRSERGFCIRVLDIHDGNIPQASASPLLIAVPCREVLSVPALLDIILVLFKYRFCSDCYQIQPAVN